MGTLAITIGQGPITTKDHEIRALDREIKKLQLGLITVKFKIWRK